MGLVVVEICDGNLIARVNLEEILEEEYPEVAVIENSCLSFCGLCAVRPYALVNGKRIFGQTPEEAVEKIKKAIEDELALFF
ncbi:DUF1450 domain-containing protein [Filobacillus milosensis]|uniref:DUF1450 domain-containing protein n=1 Tax=Filobacillus milosensis TaxID=94137 RepID=A0A4Y8IX14_9BACI|nr:DUF1450 domain-containing protein [Filobacillus milosensis]TFB24955.1 DUF1450 domain-containing protein [Filobacillus milosensis]